MKRITDKDFRYTSANATDIRVTFRRVRRELAAAKAIEDAKAVAPVLPMQKRAKS